MLKTIVTHFVRKSKNRNFAIDEKVDNRLLFEFAIAKLFQLIRGQRLLFSTRSFNRVFIGKSVSIFNKRKIIIGSDSVIGDNVRLHALCEEGLCIGRGVNIGSYSQIIVSTSFNDIGKGIDIGDNVGIGEFSYIGGAGGLVIKRDTIIGQYFSAHPENHTYSNNSVLIRGQGVVRKGIVIGSNCWIGAKVTILDGAVVGDNCVIAAGAVVRGIFSDSVLIAGVPAKIIRKLD